MLCLICCKNDDSDDYVQLGNTGVNGINRASKERQSDLRVKVGDYVHKECRSTYRHKWYISSSSSESSSSSRETKSSIGRFDFRKNCFLCGQTITEKEKRDKKTSYVLCRNRDVDNAMRKSLVERGYDDWALAVLCRIESVNELRAEDDVYHKTCNSNFRTRKNIPAKHCDVSYLL